jgi:hypothetical protein
VVDGLLSKTVFAVTPDVRGGIDAILDRLDQNDSRAASTRVEAVDVPG